LKCRKDEVASEAQKALYGFDKGETDEGRPEMPKFADMITQVRILKTSKFVKTHSFFSISD